MIVLINDITRIKDLELYSSKLRSVFFSSMAHELRTPLNTIIPMGNKLIDYIQDP